MPGTIKKKIRFRIQSQCEWIDDIKVQHVLPNQFVQAVGSFVYLEHILRHKQSVHESNSVLGGNHAHPHRGIVTLTYILFGEVDHRDSLENHVKLGSGGGHWMKAGNGVIQDQAVSSVCQITHSDVSVIQWWINLPSKYKAEEPDYLSLLPDEVPVRNLDRESGYLKVLLGEFENLSAKFPSFSKEFAWHIHLNPKKNISLNTEKTFEYAAFLPTMDAVINDTSFHSGELIVFTPFGELIEITNTNEIAVDIILFGGDPYEEPIIAEGSFVMNTPHELTQAYNDFYDGKYGQIIPEEKNNIQPI